MSSDPFDDTPLPAENEPAEAPAPMREKPEGEDSAALLAELDSLLERMMALPVNHLDEQPPEEARQQESPPEDVPIITVTEAIPDHIAPPHLPSVSTLDDDLYVQELLRQRESAPTSDPDPIIFQNPLPPEESLPILTAALPELRPALNPKTTPEGSRDSKAKTNPFLIKPMLLCNRAFDVLTGRLGRVGRALHHPLGRSLMGWAGVAMLVLVTGLALSDCLGWTR